MGTMLDLHLSLTNIRRFFGESKIPIAPLTLLYGENGIGKSAIIESLAIFHQTPAPNWDQDLGTMVELGPHSWSLSGHLHDVLSRGRFSSRNPGNQLIPSLGFGHGSFSLSIDCNDTWSWSINGMLTVTATRTQGSIAGWETGFTRHKNSSFSLLRACESWLEELESNEYRSRGWPPCTADVLSRSSVHDGNFDWSMEARGVFPRLISVLTGRRCGISLPEELSDIELDMNCSTLIKVVDALFPDPVEIIGNTDPYGNSLAYWRRRERVSLDGPATLPPRGEGDESSFGSVPGAVDKISREVEAECANEIGQFVVHMLSWQWIANISSSYESLRANPRQIYNSGPIVSLMPSSLLPENTLLNDFSLAHVYECSRSMTAIAGRPMVISLFDSVANRPVWRHRLEGGDGGMNADDFIDGGLMDMESVYNEFGMPGVRHQGALLRAIQSNRAHNLSSLINGSFYPIVIGEKGDCQLVSETGQGIQRSIALLANMISKEISLIQQPETHLHPKQQWVMGRELARLATSAVPVPGNPFGTLRRFTVVETHSEYLLRGVQQAVRDGLILPSEVVVLEVRGGSGNGGSYVRPHHLSARGDFNIPWPSDFFPDPRISL